MPLESMIRRVRKEDLRSLVQLMAEHARFERAAFETTGKVPKLERLIFGPASRLDVWVVEGSGESLWGRRLQPRGLRLA